MNPSPNVRTQKVSIYPEKTLVTTLNTPHVSICNLTEQDQLKTFIGYYIEYYNQEYCQEYEYHDKEWKCFSNGWVTNTPDYSQSTPEYTATRRPHPDPDDSHTINKVIVKEL
ncbi:unnamed protein product [Oppiella nova]|uniref:Uncharacterized protein n=1 Tax=Oppiella nova TaxID=334625 RepID=A0A7R9LTW7_9ACAR|nr:unnamed protein product [Oppiella nova]CAG2166930.1 unnamed protein product [Oppiella nova]